MAKSILSTLIPPTGPTKLAKHGDHEMVMSFGNSYLDTQPTQRRLKLSDLIQQFHKPDLARGNLPLDAYLSLDKTIALEKNQRDKEKDGAYVIAGAFTKPGTRSAADLATLSGFFGDIDTGNLSLDDISRRLTGFVHIIFSSYSYHPDARRWRFFIPYKHVITPAQHNKVYDFLQAQFQDLLDKRCGTTNQLWYTPACPPDARDKYVFIVGDGDLLDVDVIQGAAAVAQPSKSAPTKTTLPTIKPAKNLTLVETERLKSALSMVPAEEYNDWIRIGLALRHDLGVEAGYAIWLEWSRKSAKFDADVAESTWTSFKDNSSNPVTIGTIIHMAREAGWVDVVVAMDPKLQDLNDTHFLSMEGGRTWVYNEYFDNEMSRLVLRRMYLKSFKEYYANQTITVQRDQTLKAVDIGTAWHHHPARRTYSGVVFLPGLATPVGHYNLWQGYGVTPTQGDWSLLQAHIVDVICDGDAMASEYLFNWMANAVQAPHKLGEVAVVLKGERGTGKGKLASMFCSLFGQHALQITSAKHLVGNFNAHLQSCVFLFVDEALWAGDKAGENVLKGLITESTLVIEKKGQDVVRAPNRLHIMMASNHDWVIPAGNKERRFFVLEASSKHIQDLPYFAAIDQQMLHQGGLSAMLYDLMHRNLSGFNVRTVVKNAALDEQVLRSLDPPMQWWMDLLGKSHLHWQFQQRSILAENFGDAKGTYTGKSSETALGMFLRKVLPKGSLKKVQHQFPHQSQLADCYEFPDQPTCKAFLIAMLGLQSDPWV